MSSSIALRNPELGAAMAQTLLADPRWRTKVPEFKVNVLGQDYKVKREADGSVSITHGSLKQVLVNEAKLLGSMVGLGSVVNKAAAPSAAPAPSSSGGDWSAELPDGSDPSGANMPAGSTTPPAAGGLNWGTLLKYGPSAGASAISAVLGNRQANKSLEGERQRTALTESTLDPFRGYMAQAKDSSALDRYATQNYTAAPTQLDPKYGAGMTPAAPRSYGPSPDERTLLTGARDQIAAGDAAPPITPGAQSLPMIRILNALKRRAQPTADAPLDSQASQSWLT